MLRKLKLMVSNDNKEFRQAIIWGNDEEAVRILKKGDVHLDPAGDTPLLLAAYHGRETIAEMLLERKANVDAKTEDNETALHLAASKGSLEIVSLLLKYNANVNIKNRYGETPLISAFKFSNPNKTDIIKALLEHKADVNVTDIRGMSALTLAINHNLKDISTLLLDRNADVNLSKHGATKPLAAASMENREPEIVKKLIEKKADINHADSTGITALMKASAYGYENIVNLLLEHKANPSLRDCRGSSATQYVLGEPKIMIALRKHIIYNKHKAILQDGLFGKQNQSTLKKLSQHPLFDPHLVGVIEEFLKPAGSKK